MCKKCDSCGQEVKDPATEPALVTYIRKHLSVDEEDKEFVCRQVARYIRDVHHIREKRSAERKYKQVQEIEYDVHRSLLVTIQENLQSYVDADGAGHPSPEWTIQSTLTAIKRVVG